MIENFETDNELAIFLEDFGIELVEAYDLIDHFDSPTIPTLTEDVSIFRLDDTMCFRFHKKKVHLTLSQGELDNSSKWTLQVRYPESK